MTNHFDDPKLLIARAHERTRQLEQRIERFVHQQPYAHVVEPDAQGHIAYKIRVTQPVPADASVDAFEVVSLLRAALDQAVYAATVALKGGKPTSTKFPFGRHATSKTAREMLEDDIRKRCRDVPPAILDLIRSLKPHEGGDDALWALNELRNTKNHRALLRMDLRVDNSVFLRFLTGAFTLGRAWCAEKQELTYLSGPPPGPQGQFEVTPSLGVVVGQTPVLGGKPAVAVFDHLGRKTAGIVRAIEAETARLLCTATP